MAKSLRCGVCGILLRNVAEAQSHGEVTGHSSFEETTEVIKVMKCVTCGKPCRTDAERDMHKRFTGHTEYVEETAQATLNTEQEMKEARDAMEEDADILRASLGKPPRAKGAAAAAGTSDTDAGGGCEAGTSGGEMVPAEVPEVLLKEMEEMGFARNRAVRAIWFSKAVTSVEAAVNWLLEHDTDPDVDEPLMVKKADLESSAGISGAGDEEGSGKEPVDPVEARRKAEELIRKAREKREKEEKELERQRELERIRAGKEMQKMREKDEELALKRIAEQRKREKEEEARAREELRKKLEEDRKERRRRLGLPEELTEEEKAREAEKRKKQEEEEAAKKAFSYVKPVSALSKMRTQLVDLKKAHAAGAAGGSGEAAFKTACETMMRYLGNIAASPGEEKFRTIRLGNAAFQQRVASLPGAVDFLVTCGFEKKDDALVMLPEKLNVELLRGAGGALDEALTNPFFGAL
ncbi:hypothetical protein VOLCADRAFT_119060 [Volvox carteri f. nagariensis]|uniref:UBA domain-containing protein n=1 Tax=Volvox carteri f. nagariensis TaxID=3068 RepID=D8U9T0_VOLCA|nr:uncharacterized protein VOLCADRAFT_119060 [Volvox carteri f. nagariensis]EFJ43466.1 hypothetical protein VOLCADRAFT_119060 [Volvox carteri f. nagariensis]|eukprot:XP_002955395.1 hypothetical protein VOLCADRAFT_119060 [Volvox carteri f. nagariensis]